MRLLERLNRPAAGLLALIVLLIVYGALLLFYTNTTSVSPEPESGSVDGATNGLTAGASMQQETTSETTGSNMTTGGTEKTLDGYVYGTGPLSNQRPGIAERVSECEEAQDQEGCIRDLVAYAAPEALYIGTRTELNVGGEDRNNQVLYFEDPNLKSCEFTRKEFSSEGSNTYHSVIIAGEGSFSDERDQECVIEF